MAAAASIRSPTGREALGGLQTVGAVHTGRTNSFCCKLLQASGAFM